MHRLSKVQGSFKSAMNACDAGAPSRTGLDIESIWDGESLVVLFVELRSCTPRLRTLLYLPGSVTTVTALRRPGSNLCILFFMKLKLTGSWFRS